MKSLVESIRFCVAVLLLCCVAYPLVVFVIAHGAFRGRSEGSLIGRDGKVAGSALIAQDFESPRYFHSRPSAVDYNASGSGASNLGPTNPVLLQTVEDRMTSATAMDDVAGASVAGDRVTASASGLDPHISPRNALQQAARIARARGIPAGEVVNLINRLTEKPLLGFMGPATFNVLKANLALDRLKT